MKRQSKIEMMTRQTKDNHLIHKQAISAVIDNLPMAVDMDVLEHYSPYDVDWNGLKILIKAARPTRKATQKATKWFYSLKEKDLKIVDYIILFALSSDKQVRAVYVLPKAFSPTRYITITQLNGNIRYQYFRTPIEELAKKILEVKKSMPRLVKIYKRAKILGKI